MKTQTHTPGPWETPGIDSDGRIICANVNGKRRTIAHVYSPVDRLEAERDGNARLIASAPDMLKALKMAVEMFDEMSADDMAPLVRRSARNLAIGAIKLAEGRI